MPAAKSRSWHLGRVQIIFFILSSVCSQLVCGYWSGSLFPLDRLVDSAARNAAPKSEPPITALNHVASDLLAMPLNRIERFLGKPNGFAVQQPVCREAVRRTVCNGWLECPTISLIAHSGPQGSFGRLELQAYLGWHQSNLFSHGRNPLLFVRKVLDLIR